MPQPRLEGPSAFISVMEGCSKYCTFCVVPYTRGEEVSRPFDDVLAEISQLADKGVREINLLGQNVNAFRGLNHLGDIVDFAELLHLVNLVPGIDRIRYTTSHPRDMDDDLIADERAAAVGDVRHHVGREARAEAGAGAARLAVDVLREVPHEGLVVGVLAVGGADLVEVCFGWRADDTARQEKSDEGANKGSVWLGFGARSVFNPYMWPKVASGGRPEF